MVMLWGKMEYDMRAEIFDHMQHLPFSFYDDAKVGQLMSRITSDLFDITELLHHGPENIILSVLKIFGALVTFAILMDGDIGSVYCPSVMFWFALSLIKE